MLGFQPREGLGPQLSEGIHHAVPFGRFGDGDLAAHEVEGNVGQQDAARAHGAGLLRHDYHRDTALLRHLDRMQRTGTTVGIEREPRQVIAPLGRYRADGTAHIGIGDTDDSLGRFLQRDAERCRDLLGDHAAGARQVDRHAALEQRNRIEPLQRDLGIGDSSLRAAPRIADRPRHGTGAVRADLERAGIVAPRDAAPAGADHMDIHHRCLDRITRDLPVGGE